MPQYEPNLNQSVTALLLQMSGLARRIEQLKQSGNESELHNYLYHYKQKLEELQVCTGGTSEGYSLVETVAQNNGIDMQDIYAAAAACQPDNVVEAATSNSAFRFALLNPSSVQGSKLSVVNRAEIPDESEPPVSSGISAQDDIAAAQQRQIFVDNALAAYTDGKKLVKGIGSTLGLVPKNNSGNALGFTKLFDDYSSNVLYSLSHANKSLAPRYATKIMQAAMQKYGSMNEAEAEKAARNLRNSLADFNISDAQAMDLMYRISQKPQLTVEQQKDLSNQLKANKGFSAFMQYYGDEIQSFVKDNPNVQEGIVNYLSKPENEDMAKQFLPYLTDAAIQQMGFENTTWAQSMVSGLTETFGMPAHAVVGMFKGGKNFFSELFDPTVDYNTQSPLQRQLRNKAFSDTRTQVLKPMHDAQIEAGMANLDKLLPWKLEEQTKRSIVSLLNSPGAKMGFKAISGQLANLLGDDPRAQVIMNAISKNYEGIISGFQGDYTEVFDVATADTYDRRALEQYGLMATRLSTIKPSVENKFMRAEDYRSAMSGLVREGLRPDALITRRDEDVYRQLVRLAPERKEQIINEMGAAEMERAIKRWADSPDLQKKMDQDAYRAAQKKRITEQQNEIRAAFNTDDEGTLAKNIANLRKKGMKNGMADMLGDLTNQVGAYGLEDMVQLRAETLKDVENVLANISDPTGFLEKLPGSNQEKMLQVVRMLGGSDVSGDFSKQAERAMSTLTSAASAGMNLERTISLVSETGKTAQALGLTGDSVQVAGNIAASMVAAASKLYKEGGLDMNRLQAHAARNAAGITNSQTGRQMVFLMNQKFKDNTRMKELQEKILSGQPLDENELKDITEANLRNDFDGSPDEFDANMSSSVFNYYLNNMNAEQMHALRLNATTAEQGKFLKEFDARSSMFTTAMTKRDIETLGYTNQEDFYQTYRSLMGKVTAKRAHDLMTGNFKSLTEEEEEILGPDLVAKFQEIKNRNISPEERARLSAQVGAAGTRLANSVRSGMKEDDAFAAVAHRTQEQENLEARAAKISTMLPGNKGVALFEKFVNSDERDYWKRLGALGKDWLSNGTLDRKNARDTLLNQNNFALAYLDIMGRAGSMEAMFHNMGLDKKKQQKAFAEKLGYKDTETESAEQQLYRDLSGGDFNKLEEIAEKYRATSHWTKSVNTLVKGAEVTSEAPAKKPKKSKEKSEEAGPKSSKEAEGPKETKQTTTGDNLNAPQASFRESDKEREEAAPVAPEQISFDGRSRLPMKKGAVRVYVENPTVVTVKGDL